MISLFELGICKMMCLPLIFIQVTIYLDQCSSRKRWWNIWVRGVQLQRRWRSSISHVQYWRGIEFFSVPEQMQDLFLKRSLSFNHLYLLFSVLTICSLYVHLLRLQWPWLMRRNGHSTLVLKTQFWKNMVEGKFTCLYSGNPRLCFTIIPVIGNLFMTHIIFEWIEYPWSPWKLLMILFAFGRFKDIFEEVYGPSWKTKYEEAGIWWVLWVSRISIESIKYIIV